MRNKVRTMLCVLFIGLLCTASAVFAATVCIPDLSSCVEPGANVALPITVDNAAGIAGVQLTFTWNSSVLNCTGATAGSLTNGWIILPNCSNGTFGGFSPTLTELPASSGSLVILKFTAVGGAGSSTNVCITATALTNSLGAPITATVCNDGCTTVNICGGCVPTGKPDSNCDGVDDDCNGTPDDAYVPSTTNCGVGVCARTGQNICQNGSIVNTCQPGNATGTDNNCNGVDENCNGTNDENYVPTPTTCGVGACASIGQKTCVNGQLQDSCQPGTPQTEGPYGNATCSDGKDNDCDGFTDTADPNCAPVCVPTGKADSNCDGVDDDCNGTPDDKYVATDTTCGKGVCAATGKLICQNGATVNTCKEGTLTGTDNNCNGIDENCNGTADENYVALTTNCGMGVCAATGQKVCQNGSIVDTCKPGTPTETLEKTCNDGKDNDCDGKVDCDDPDCTSVCGGELISANVVIDPATLNIRSRGMFITCYIELPSPNNVQDIDVKSIVLKDGNTVVTTALTLPVEVADTDLDTVPNLIIKFDRKTVIDYLISAGKTSAIVEFTVDGSLKTGQSFEGKDKVRVINPPRVRPTLPVR